MKVAVVIPAFNAEDTIERCLLSVINQSLAVNEIIIIDDGSTDRTLEILKKIKSSTNTLNFIIISQNNAGPSSARNNGINCAKSEWIAFLDSDDEWKPNKLEIQLNALLNNEDYVLCGCLYGKKKPIKGDLINEIDFKKHLFKPYFNTPTIIAKSKILKEFLFNEKQHYAEDYRLWLQINNKYKCIRLNQYLARNINNKNNFGESGLSSNLWKMEIGELSNFWFLFRTKRINFIEMILTSTFSLAKYIRRYIITRLKKERIN